MFKMILELIQSMYFAVGTTSSLLWTKKTSTMNSCRGGASVDVLFWEVTIKL